MRDLEKIQRLRLESRMKPEPRIRSGLKCFLLILLVIIPFSIVTVFLILINRDIPAVICRPKDFTSLVPNTTQSLTQSPTQSLTQSPTHMNSTI